ncbi:MAG: aminoacyl-tRNA hydrolase [Bacteroidales bacterium]|nr:aminoacyl-tRNA hydrolase [Bacteroidales bacterium]
MKYLVVGLGNIGVDYEKTRHNIGFRIVDFLAAKFNCTFKENSISYYSKFLKKEKEVFLIKPKTYMNLSGKVVKFWSEKENILINNLMVIVDDVSLPFGTIRIRPYGKNAGHNGLESIDLALNTNKYPRLRFGICNETFVRHNLSNFVLSNFTEYEEKFLPFLTEKASEAVLNFIFQGIEFTMNKFNKNHLKS